jgi:hypothetical protein
MIHNILPYETFTLRSRLSVEDTYDKIDALFSTLQTTNKANCETFTIVNKNERDSYFGTRDGSRFEITQDRRIILRGTPKVLIRGVVSKNEHTKIRITLRLPKGYYIFGCYLVAFWVFSSIVGTMNKLNQISPFGILFMLTIGILGYCIYILTLKFRFSMIKQNLEAFFKANDTKLKP